jgi:hypothetical protein
MTCCNALTPRAGQSYQPAARLQRPGLYRGQCNAALAMFISADPRRGPSHHHYIVKISSPRPGLLVELNRTPGIVLRMNRTPDR